MNSGAVDLGFSPMGLLPWLAISLPYLVATRRGGFGTTRRERGLLALGCLLGAFATSGPLAAAAHQDFLWAMVAERLVLLLAVPPLLLAGTSRALAGRLTRPRLVDRLVLVLARPVVAIFSVTALLAATVLPGVVATAAHHAAVATLVDAAVVAAGLILWLPTSERFPGVPTLSAGGQCGYLVVQGVAPTFLSVVWIFARHPLYPALGASSRKLMDPVLDQRLAGFIAKFATLAVLFVVAFVVLVRADPDEDLRRQELRDDDLARVVERARRRPHG